MKKQLTGEDIVIFDRTKKLKQAHHQMRHGPDLTRRVKSWPRMQAVNSLKGKEGPEDMIVQGTQKVSGWSAFVREMFGRLYTGDGLSSTGEPQREHAWARELHSALDELPEWQRLLKRCKGDSYNTAAATLGLNGKLVEHIPRHSHDAEESRRMYDLMMSEWNEACDEAKCNGLEPPPMPNDLKFVERRLEAARQEATALASNMNPSTIRQACRQAIEQANGKLDEVDSALSAVGWGIQDAGPGEESAEAVKRAVAERLEQAERLRRIMEVAGRFKNIMKECQAAKVRHGCGEITDIQKGNDLARFLPSETVMMKSKIGKGLLFKKMLERNVLQYKLEGKEPVGKGPIVLCIDDSSSMSEHREVWSKALALAILELARKQKRSFEYCLFSSKVVFEFTEKRGDKVKPGQIIDGLIFHQGGGTDFDQPLEWALSRIEKVEKLKEADIIFISDGECQARQTEKIKKRIEKTGTRVWGIALGHLAIANEAPGSMNDFCNKVYPINQIDAARPGEEDEAAARGVLSI